MVGVMVGVKVAPSAVGTCDVGLAEGRRVVGTAEGDVVGASVGM